MQTFLLPNGSYRNVSEKDIAAFLQENPDAKQVSSEDYSIAATEYSPIDPNKVKEEQKKLNQEIDKRQEAEYLIKNEKGDIGGTYSRTELESFYPNLKNDAEFQRYINKYSVRQSDNRSKAVIIGDPYASSEQLSEVTVTADAFPEASKEIEKTKEKEKKEADIIFSKDYNPVEILGYDRSGKYRTRTKETASIREEYLKKYNNDLAKAKEAYLDDKNKNRLGTLVENELLTEENDFLKQKAKNIAKTGQAIEKEDIILAYNKINKLNSLFAKSFKETEDIVSKKYTTNLEVKQAKEKLKSQAAIQRAIIDKYKEQEEKTNKLYSELDDEARLLNIAKRDYGKINNLVGKLLASGSKLGAGVLAIPSWITSVKDKAIEEIFGKDSEFPTWAQPLALKGFETFGKSSGVKEFIDDLVKYEQKERSKLARPTDISEGFYGSWVADLVGNQLPQFAVMMLAPEASLGLLATSAAGGKFLDMNEEIAAGKDYTAWQMLLAPSFVGAAEYLTERITLGQTKALRSFFKKNPASLDAAQNYLNQNLNKIVLNIPKEGGSEG